MVGWAYGTYMIVGLFMLLFWFIALFSNAFDDVKWMLMSFAGVVLWPLSVVVAVIYGTLLGLYRVQLMFQSACYQIAKEYKKEVKRNDLTSP